MRNILRVKILLGLFENPYVDVEAGKAVQYAPEHLAAAQKTAEESAILLKNDGVLPLKADAIRNILVTGPMADAPHEQLGTWAFDGQSAHTVTPLKALQERFPGKVTFVQGLKNSRSRRERFDDVVAAARRADVVLVFLGEEAILSGEAHSLADLNLKGAQSALLAALKAAGKPVVATVMAGRPLTIERDLPNCNALLYAFHPGTMGGPALANLLTGAVNPSGKTPVTFLRTVGQAPLYYSHNRTGRPYNGETLLDDTGQYVLLPGLRRLSAVPLRLWPELHDLRLFGHRPGPQDVRGGGYRTGFLHAGQHRRLRWHGGCADLRPGSGGFHHPSGQGAEALRARCPGTGGEPDLDGRHSGPGPGLRGPGRREESGTR